MKSLGIICFPLTIGPASIYGAFCNPNAGMNLWRRFPHNEEKMTKRSLSIVLYSYDTMIVPDAPEITWR